MKKVLIAGATGMVGGHVLEYCMASPEISDVIILSRRPLGLTEPKIREVLHEDYSAYEPSASAFEGVSAAFFCIGVYTGQVDTPTFEKITVDYAVEFGKMLKSKSPDATLCLLSGAGADRTEQSRVAFARFKGMAENQLAALEMKWHTFRPGYIYPVVKRKEPNLMYKISRALYPLLKLFGNGASIKSTVLAKAMVEVGLHGHKNEILENKDIYFVVNDK